MSKKKESKIGDHIIGDNFIIGHYHSRLYPKN